MLLRKTFREIRQNFGQFFSLFVLVALAAALYAGFMADPLGGNAAREAFHEKAGLASVWMYGEGFGKEDLAAVRALDFVESAQLRTSMTGSAPEQGGAEIDLYLEEENLVNRPQTMSGADFDPADPEGLWINQNFAAAWNLSPGDPFTVSVDGVNVTKEIRGIVLSPEYEYMCASTDADTNFANIGYVFMGTEGFPFREYLEHMIANEKITAADILEEAELPAGVQLLLGVMGITKDTSAEKLLELSRRVSDGELQEMIPYTQLVIRGQNGAPVLDREAEIAAAVGNEYAVMVDASSLPGINRLTAELEQHAGFSYVFMAVFLAIALLVIVTGMSRMVERQRVQIGTMNALGMKRWKISLHYIGYSVLVALAGGLVGMLCGYFLLGRWTVSLFSAWYVVPGWKAGADWTFAGLVAAITLLCGLASWLSCRRLLRVAPGEALRPAAPKSGRRTLFEKLPFWERLGFSARYNLRDISRYKLRAVMGVFGTGVGITILTGTLAALTMMDSVYDWTFSKIQNFSYEALLSGDIRLAEADALAEQLSGELVMQAGIELAAKPDAMSGEKTTQVLTVTEGKGLYRITDPKARVTELPAGTAAITYGLSKRLGVGVGDTVWWHIYEENTWYSSVIGVINRTPETSGITLLREDLEAAGARFTPTLLATDDGAVQTISHEGIGAVYGVAELREIYEEQMQIIWALVAAMLIFSLVMIVAVLYNTGNLSFHERAREFATLKVLGFSTQKIRSLLTRQNFWLSVIGIVLGAPFGGVMLEAMMNSNGDNFDYFATVTPRDVLLAGLFVLAVSMAVSFLFNGKIRKLDMVENLKGAE